MGKKREREEVCDVCGHYHNHEEGEVCNICGHQVITSGITKSVHVTSSPSEILPEFLYLGGFNEAFLLKMLKTLGFSHILNTVPSCENLYSSMTYHRLQDEKALEFDNAINFLDECEKSKSRVLVHCMSGKSRSPAIVIAYLMKRKGWRLAESYQWVKQRRPSTDISPGKSSNNSLKSLKRGYLDQEAAVDYLSSINDQLQDFTFGAVDDDTPMDRS